MYQLISWVSGLFQGAGIAAPCHVLPLQVLEANDRPLMYRLHQLGAAECHFAYRMVVVMMRRDMPMNKVSLGLHAS